MAGRKHHFIPQLVLRGFEACSSGKLAQVFVFRSNGLSYRSSTQGVAAERDFYSQPSAGQTLDDKITDYEGSVLAPGIAALREVPVGLVESNLAAAVVVHLSMRSAFLRGALSAGAISILEHFSTALRSHDATRALLEIDSPQPDSMLARAVRDKVQNTFEELPGGAEEAVTTLMHFAVREKFQRAFPQLAAAALQHLCVLVDTLPNSMIAAHRAALEKELVPAQRVERLKQMSWRIIAADDSSYFVLPDCLAIGSSSARLGCMEPYCLLNDEELFSVVMPVSASKVLIGCLGHLELDIASLNHSFARCSLDFFVSSRSDDETAKAAELIGTSVSNHVNQLADGEQFAVPNPICALKVGTGDRNFSPAKLNIKFEPSGLKSAKLIAALRGALLQKDLQVGLRVVESIVVTDDVRRSLSQRGLLVDDLGYQAVKHGLCHTILTPKGVSSQIVVPLNLVRALATCGEFAPPAAALIRFHAGRAVYAATLVAEEYREPTKSPESLLQNVCLRMARFVCSNYFGWRLCAPSVRSEADFNDADSELCAVMTAKTNDFERVRQHFLEHQNVETSLKFMLIHAEVFLCAVTEAYATELGDVGRWRDSKALGVLRAVGLGDWFSVFAHDLEKCFALRLDRQGKDQLAVLALHVERILWSFGFVLSTKVPEQIWMDVLTDDQLAAVRATLRS